MAGDKVVDILNMSALGDKLRQAREGKNLTIGQAQKQTRIHSTVLKAIEEGKCDSMLNPTYVKSFLKQYCDYLGLDSRQALGEYKKLHPETESMPVYRLQDAAKENSKGLSDLIPFIKLVAVGAVIAALVVFAGLKIAAYFKKPVRSKHAMELKVKRQPVHSKSSGKPPALKSAAPKKDMEISIPKNVKLKLLLKVNQNVLVKMRTDGVLLFERVLTKGTAELFTADNVINVFAANGEYIELILNGKAIGSPGRGVLKNIEITRSGIRLK